MAGYAFHVNFSISGNWKRPAIWKRKRVSESRRFGIRVFVPDTVPDIIAELSLFLTEFIVRIEAFTGGSILSVNPSVIMGIYGNRVVPTLESDVQEKAYFRFEDNSRNAIHFEVPTLDESFVLNNSDKIDREAPAIASFLEIMLDPVTAGFAAYVFGDIENIPTNPERLTWLVDAREVFRK